MCSSKHFDSLWKVFMLSATIKKHSETKGLSYFILTGGTYLPLRVFSQSFVTFEKEAYSQASSFVRDKVAFLSYASTGCQVMESALLIVISISRLSRQRLLRFRQRA